MTRHRITLGLLLLLLVILAGCWYCYTESIDLETRVVSIIVAPGDGFNSVTARLLDSGVVRSRLMLKIPARLRGIDKHLIPGRYDFTGSNSCRSVLSKLEQGDFVTIKVTIPEGSTIWQLASTVAERMELDSAEIIALIEDSTLLTNLKQPSLEGYLFPETYFFPWRTEARTILGDMVAMYMRMTAELWPDEIYGGLSRSEVIVLASIIEAEAFIDDEKPRIASVYHNRLRIGMKLDADPTVIYGLGGLDRPLSRRDLRTITPYNTYVRKGLPPTPINSPGLAAIRAALYPEANDFLFFVADGTGHHRFSRTNAEHNRARREIQRQK